MQCRELLNVCITKYKATESKKQLWRLSTTKYEHREALVPISLTKSDNPLKL